MIKPITRTRSRYRHQRKIGTIHINMKSMHTHIQNPQVESIRTDSNKYKVCIRISFLPATTNITHRAINKKERKRTTEVWYPDILTEKEINVLQRRVVYSPEPQNATMKAVKPPSLRFTPVREENRPRTPSLDAEPSQKCPC